MAFTYPQTRRDDTVDTYFDTPVADPYRWLEDDRSEETAAWVKTQNAVTFDYLSNIRYRDDIRARLDKSQNYERISQPFVQGGYTYFYKNDGLQNQPVLYRYKDDSDAAHVFLDPNTFNEEGTTSLDAVRFSKDNRFCAYSISEAGSDWRTIFVIDTETGEQVEAPIENAKFTDISWLGNQGFYYCGYDLPDGSELSAKTEQHKLYFHTIGRPQSSDELVFGAKEDQIHRYVSGYTTEDDRFLVITAAVATACNRLYIQDLTQDNAALITVVDHLESDNYVIDNDGDTLIIYTNYQAPNSKVVRVNAADPSIANWEDLIPEQNEALNISTGGGYLFANYMRDVFSDVVQYDKAGNKVREIAFPSKGSVSGLSGKSGEVTLYYTFQNYITPPSIFSFNVESGESHLYRRSPAPFDSDVYESKQVFYTSRDGTQVPMIISHKKGLTLDNSTPTILYGYGGFNVSLTPVFSPNIAAWLELGGVYAIPALRGGGEYGKAWHIAGTQQQKQNVFDDFIAAGEYLIEAGYTSKEKLAIRGGSNGGLLVGACLTQRPDLFKVALPAVGVLDMLRYHTFTAGEGWAYDYGTSAQSPEMFQYLLGYSPVHNVKPGVEYPATMVTTADHDDRVVPAHSYKFIAELQRHQQGENPTFIRIDVNAGHGAGMPVSMLLDQIADLYAFTLHNMGVKSL
ncbi:prolyl oligopeptidase family serine peptidase [Thaumasiovibrio subtropicus]|uniref:prolyl oligopeptidase family serine peptidase n=1 Tax=Thaumasiovibrio subtropicus TaxID=1891207 RepID=UPI000B362E17|nr:prolyl oligopeptidase family serine peptidase [Thaumasiovibrio subtropicus]